MLDLSGSLLWGAAATAASVDLPELISVVDVTVMRAPTAAVRLHAGEVDFDEMVGAFPLF